MLHRIRTAFAPILLLVGLAVLAAGCSGTRFAYSQAETLEDTAKVVVAHYTAVANEAAAIIESLESPDGEADHVIGELRDADAHVYPLIEQLRGAAEAYTATRNAETRAELEAALADAVEALSAFIDAIEQQ